MKDSSVKRKAESDPAEETEESGDEMEESGDDLSEPTCWKPPEWGEDSYDDVEYHSEEMDLFRKDPERERQWRRCKRQLIANKGFYVEDELLQVCRYSNLIPVPNLDEDAAFGQTYRDLFAEMACFCLHKYNKQEGLNVELVEVVRGLYSRGAKWKSYITFHAREKPDGPLVPYQAKVWSGFKQGENYPILCRPAPPAKP